MLNELCSNNDLTIIALQKHWIHSDELDIFKLVHSDYNLHAISCCLGRYLERYPFGGVAFYDINREMVESTSCKLIY